MSRKNALLFEKRSKNFQSSISSRRFAGAISPVLERCASAPG
jgi:hypothetical protein